MVSAKFYLMNIELTRFRIYRSRVRRLWLSKQTRRKKIKKHYKRRRFRRTKRYSWDSDHFYQGKRLKKATTRGQFFEYFVPFKRKATSRLIKPVFGYNKLGDIFYSIRNRMKRRSVNDLFYYYFPNFAVSIKKISYFITSSSNFKI